METNESDIALRPLVFTCETLRENLRRVMNAFRHDGTQSRCSVFTQIASAFARYCVGFFHMVNEALRPVPPSLSKGGMREALCTEAGNVPVNLPTCPDKAENRILSGCETGKVLAPIGQIPVRVNRQGDEARRGLRREAFPVVFPEYGISIE